MECQALVSGNTEFACRWLKVKIHLDLGGAFLQIRGGLRKIVILFLHKNICCGTH